MPAAANQNPLVVLTGNPNCGKTTLFNMLTGLRAKVGNYAGVTVERKEGKLRDTDITILDLPGTYSLSPNSLDEQIARDALLHHLGDVPEPDLVVIVVDASNLERNLYYATQVIELGHRTLIALNMMDVARSHGHEVNSVALSSELGVPVSPIIASTGEGIPQLRELILATLKQPAATAAPCFGQLPAAYSNEIDAFTQLLTQSGVSRNSAQAEAQLIVSDEKFLSINSKYYPTINLEKVVAARDRITAAKLDWHTAGIAARYTRITSICDTSVTQSNANRETISDRLDRVFTHRFWGLLIFVMVMALMFQSIFTFAEWPMKWIEQGVGWTGRFVESNMSEGEFRSLLVDGVIAGVGSVLIFLPQICLLFLYIGLLEDTGYMARAAFLMDRFMSKVGLHGKSFIPMLSSFACAIPGIMATRTIETPKDRLVTILVAPLMSCSARLPVYTVLIAACIPKEKLFGVLGLPGLTMLAMYLLGIIMALFMAFIFKRFLLKGQTPMLILELPPYRRPVLGVTLQHMWDRSKLFIRRAGTVILGISILLWFLATYPKNDVIASEFAAQLEALISQKIEEPILKEKLGEIEIARSGAQLRHSYAGQLGRFIEPVIEPLGFDWKIGIGIVASFAAREVFVSTMSTVYNVGNDDGGDDGTQSLVTALRAQKRADGSPLFTSLVAVTLMVFYVFALQCVSTIAIVRRETGGWKWPVFQWLYMGALAWVLSFVVRSAGLFLGYN